MFGHGIKVIFVLCVSVIFLQLLLLKFKVRPRISVADFKIYESSHQKYSELENDDLPKNSLGNKMYPNFQNCSTKPHKTFYTQRGQFWILEYYIPADRQFKCNESVTYTTHSEYTFLDNAEELATRWQVSLLFKVIT